MTMLENQLVLMNICRCYNHGWKILEKLYTCILAVLWKSTHVHMPGSMNLNLTEQNLRVFVFCWVLKGSWINPGAQLKFCLSLDSSSTPSDTGVLQLKKKKKVSQNGWSDSRLLQTQTFFSLHIGRNIKPVQTLTWWLKWWSLCPPEVKIDLLSTLRNIHFLGRHLYCWQDQEFCLVCLCVASKIVCLH